MRLPRVRFTARWLMIAVAVAAAAMACVRGYRQLIPVGVDFYPYWYASDEGPRLTSPDGERVVQVVFNDAGGMHSGNHWTWLIVEDVAAGKRVVAEGYSSAVVRYRDAPFPLRWLDDRTFSAGFLGGRYTDRDAPLKTVVVRLP